MPKHTITTTFAAALLGAIPVIAVPSPAHAEKRHIVVLAVEPRGGATVDKEPFPTEAMQAGPRLRPEAARPGGSLGDLGLRLHAEPDRDKPG